MARKETKYTYYKVIQEYWNEWCDSDFHETDSQYHFRTCDGFVAFKTNLKAYRENAGCPIRVIRRRELKEEA